MIGLGVNASQSNDMWNKKHEGEVDVDLTFYYCFRRCHLSECGSNHHAADD